MKNLILFFTFYIISGTIYSQNSYTEQRTSLEMLVNNVFAIDDKSVLYLVAKEDYGFFTKISKKSSSREDALETVFEVAECKNCKLEIKEEAADPVDYIYKNIEMNDVYVINKLKDNYVIELFRSDE